MKTPFVAATQRVETLLLVLLLSLILDGTAGFSPTTPSHPRRRTLGKGYFLLAAKPNRLADNVDGVVYVNDRCINCAACSAFAPEIFDRNDLNSAHKVYQQPTCEAEVTKTRAALAACPVAAIRLETLAERRHGATSETDKYTIADSWTKQDEWTVQHMSPKGSDAKRPFPRPFLLNELSTVDHSVPGVFWMGHHNEASFGATPYLFQARIHDNNNVWIMVDTPKFSESAVKDVVSVTGNDAGPEYLFLTHVDDTADHNKWANRFKGLKRIFHAGDLGRHNWIGDLTLEQVEVLLPAVRDKGQATDSLIAYSLDGRALDSDWQVPFEHGELDTNVVVLHTPGHSPGSITLYKRRVSSVEPGILFTGDTYAYTTSGGGRMTGFGRYGNNKKEQIETLTRMDKLTAWDIIAPGHGHPRDYRGQKEGARQAELKVAQDDLLPQAIRK